MSKQSYTLVYDERVSEHLDAIEQKYHSEIRETIEDQLSFDPLTETRNRKPLDRPFEFGADWELRFGPDNRFRVFYRVSADERTVHILAVGTKLRNRLFFGGKEMRL